MGVDDDKNIDYTEVLEAAVVSNEGKMQDIA
jgi:hypothetical protein